MNVLRRGARHPRARRVGLAGRSVARRAAL